MILEYLSEIELYYSTSISIDDKIIFLDGDEFHHTVKVMRNKEGDRIHITDGKGTIYSSNIQSISKDHLKAEIIHIYKYENKLKHLTLCVPTLKNPDRFKFMLEKCTEFGITNFIIFNSNRSVAKIKNKGKWNNTLLSAMKQSLRSYLPEINFYDEFRDLFNLPGEKIIFDQNGKTLFVKDILKNENYFLIFGPEGGFTNQELSYSRNIYKIAENRLRSETAVIKCAALLS